MFYNFSVPHFLNQYNYNLAKDSDIPDKVSTFTNDAGYTTADDVNGLIDAKIGAIENGTY